MGGFMKRLAVCLVACWAAFHATAAEDNWLTDFAKAKTQAKQENKMILMDFNGSDWCPPCKALRKNVLSTREFEEYAKQNLVLLDVDFPHSKEQSEALKKANQELQEKFQVDGYPTIVVLNRNGKELTKKVGYAGQSTKEFIAELEKLKKKS
jgi:disulfide reductase